MNSQDETALQEARRIVKKQTIWNILKAILYSLVFFCIAIFYKIDTRNINSTLLSLNTNFGVTLSAFSLSALAIIYALHDKKIVERFTKTPGYFAMILVFKQTIFICLANFLGGYIGMLLTSFLGIYANLVITGVSIILILLAIFSVKSCADSIFIVIKSLR